MLLSPRTARYVMPTSRTMAAWCPSLPVGRRSAALALALSLAHKGVHAEDAYCEGLFHRGADLDLLALDRRRHVGVVVHQRVGLLGDDGAQQDRTAGAHCPFLIVRARRHHRRSGGTIVGLGGLVNGPLISLIGLVGSRSGLVRRCVCDARLPSFPLLRPLQPRRSPRSRRRPRSDRPRRAQHDSPQVRHSPGRHRLVSEDHQSDATTS